MTNEKRQPILVAFVSDFMTANKIENTAKHLSFQLKTIARAGDLAPLDEDAPENLPGEPVYGRQAILMERVTNWQPALLIFDLGNESIPWIDWIPRLKSSPATRRIPILCFGPHVQVEMITNAKKVGAEEVVGRSRFMSAMPQLITKLARRLDHETIAAACDEPLSGLGLQGIEAFNRGDYFDCHEYLEDAWNEDTGPVRNIYKGVLQVAVAYLQIERGNYPGAVKMFLRARQWLGPLPDVCRGIDIGRLKQDAEHVHQQLLEIGPQQIDSFDRNSFRPVNLT